jgi:colicin import membrane protein
MNSNRRIRQGVAGRPDVKLGRMVLVSLGLHLSVLLIFSGLILPRFGRVRQPVYFVDLVNLPVARPQAGRPDVRREPAKPKPAAEKKATRPEPRPAPPPPPAKPKIAAPLKTAPPAPKPPKRQPKPSYDETLKTIQEMQQAKRRQQEIDALKAKLAELAKNDTRQNVAPAAAPVGMPEGHGDQAGVEQRAWLQDFFKANWRLSKYQVESRNLEARVRVRYDAAGNLLDYKMEKSSGDQAFNDSVKRAVLLYPKLPFDPGHPIEEEVVFNLKDLLE